MLFQYKTLERIATFILGDVKYNNYRTTDNLKVYLQSLNPSHVFAQEELQMNRNNLVLSFLTKNNNIETFNSIINDILLDNEQFHNQLNEIIQKDSRYKYTIEKDSFGTYVIIEQEQNKTQKLNNTIETSTLSTSQTTLSLSFNENTREIILNDLFILSQPNEGKENHLVFKYLYERPDTKITREELQLKAMDGASLNKKNIEIINGLGFTGNLAKIFFRISSEYIVFCNHVSIETVKDLLPVRIGK